MSEETSEEIDYNAAVTLVRHLLVGAAGGSRAFSIRARGRPQLLSERGWGELAAIEALLSTRLEQVLQGELRVNPWSGLARARALWCGLRDGLMGEERLLRSLLEEARSTPVEAWRRGAPQLEAPLWGFFAQRTHHLANAAALALAEPAPFPTLIWHPGRHEFQGG